MMSNDDLFDDRSKYSQLSEYINNESVSHYSSESNGVDPRMGEEDYYCKGDDFADINESELKILLSKSVLDSVNETTFDKSIIKSVCLKTKNDSKTDIFDLLTKGNEEQKISLFQNKNKEQHIEIQKCIESHPEIVSTIIHFIHIYFCNFFDSTEEGFSLELLKFLITQFEEKDANDFLWDFANNYQNIKEKEKAIEVILLFFNIDKYKPKKQLMFLLGFLYIVARNLKEMLTDMKSIELVYSIINKKNEYINNMLFKLILDSVKNDLFQINELIFVKQVIVDKYNNNFEKCIPFKQLKNALDKRLPKPSFPNLREYLLSFINYPYNPDKDEELTNLLLIKAKQQTCSQELQDLAKENQDIVNNIFTPFLIANIYELSIDKYAKFLVLEIIEHFPEEKFPVLIEALKPQFAVISIDKHGTKVIQSILNRCCLFYCNSLYNSMSTGRSLLALICLLNNISTNIVKLMTNKHSAHIVTTLLTCQIPSINDLLYQILANNLMEIVTNQFGCGRIKEILQLKINNIANFCQYLIKEVANDVNLPKIISDQYGHYLIIYLLTIPYNFPYKNKILDYMRLNFILFAKQKYSSSIIEKCAEKTNLFDSELKNDIYVKELATDPIGSYILLTTIHSNESLKQNLKMQISKSIRKYEKENGVPIPNHSLLREIKKNK